MTGASLVLCLVLGQAPAADPFDLVSRLGAPRFPEREQAAGALERLGRAALPALRSARDSKDLEIRTRASALITKIEGSLLTQASMVRLDFNDTPLPEVIRSVTAQTGIKLALIPENSPAWANRRVTLRDADPVPFWKAVDRICDAAHLQYNNGMHVANGREPTFPLFEGAGRPQMPVSDSGPFRVSVVGLHFQRDVNFAAGPQVNRAFGPASTGGKAVPTLNEQFYAQLQVTGEPRLSVAQNGPLRVTEAVDDRGQALVSPMPAGGPATQRISGYFGFATGPVVQIQAVMTRPSQPGTSIRRLKGVIPLTVSTRKPNPLTASLVAPPGRTVQNDDVAITVHESRPGENNRPGTLEITLRPIGGTSAGFNPNDPTTRPDANQQQIEIVDAQGRLMPWYSSNYDVESGRMTMAFPSHEPGVKAVELRYFGLIRSTAEVPFEFTDLPLP